jgi:hypothetical protein
VLQKIVTDNVTAHAVSVDPSTGNVVVPIKAKGIQIYALGGSSTTSGSGTPTASPSSTSKSAGAQNARIGALFGMVAAATAFAWLL